MSVQHITQVCRHEALEFDYKSTLLLMILVYNFQS